MNAYERSERTLDTIQSRLAASYEDVGAGVVEVDSDGRILRVNQHSCEKLGYSVAELLGRTIFEETHPEDVDRDCEQFRRQLAGEIERYTIEKRLRKKDGHFIWAEVTSSCVRDVEGKFLHAVRVQHDITVRKQAEFALARRMDEQAALFQFSQCPQHVVSIQEIYEVAVEAIMRALDCEGASILMFDRADVMRFVAWRGLSWDYRKAVEGYSPWASDEKNLQPVVVENVAVSDLPAGLREAIAREGIGALVFIPILQSARLVGKFMAYYARPCRLSEPQVAVALTLAHQLSFSAARLKAEEAKRLAERCAVQLSAIVESSDDAIISKDLNGVIQTWNAGAERLFGYSAEEAIGRPVTIIFPPDKENEEPGILSRIVRGERIDHYETVRRRKDGSLVEISLTVSPMRDSSGAIIGASKIARDISERKESQRKLEESERLSLSKTQTRT